MKIIDAAREVIKLSGIPTFTKTGEKVPRNELDELNKALHDLRILIETHDAKIEANRAKKLEKKNESL